MFKKLSPNRKAALTALLETFRTSYGLPISLFEEQNGRIKRIVPEEDTDEYDKSYCKEIKGFPAGREACNTDQCIRVRQVLRDEEECLTLCHAGLCNQAIPIRVNGKTTTVLLFGEMRIVDDTNCIVSMKNHYEAVAKLDATKEQKEKLGELFLQTNEYTLEELGKFKATIPKIASWFYQVFDQEKRLGIYVETLTHEIQTQIQGAMALAENLFTRLSSPSKGTSWEADISGELLYRTLAMGTLIQTLGDFSPAYKFRREALRSLLEMSINIYQPESARRNIRIDSSLELVDGREPFLEISKQNLQFAFNNLTHNAIKYSFYGSDAAERFVRITGKPIGNYYRIVFENYGIGILAEEIENGLIFQDEYQGKLTKQEYRTGLGKGLYFVDSIIDRHNGMIKVTSEKQSYGTSPMGEPHLNRFKIYLPFKQPKEHSHEQDNNLD